MRRFSVSGILAATTIMVLLMSCASSAYQPHQPQSPKTSRRAFLASAAGAAAAAAVMAPTAPTMIAQALDMDAFVQQELSKDNDTPALSEDAALCKYGFPSPQTGEACLRAGLPTTRGTTAVDAFGQANRGDFVRCKQFYEDDGKGLYVKKTTCSDGGSR